MVPGLFIELGSWQRVWLRVGKAEIDVDMVEERKTEKKEEEEEDN